MTLLEVEKRKRVMRRSMALGHCICDPRKLCPCDVFTEQGYCHCAGERPRMADGPVRLTQHVHNAGCASKISKAVLHEVLQGLPEIKDPRVVVGASAGDDAGVMMLSKDTASILTVDVFCPSVDDPYTFGQVAAANSLSDIYAMGGTPQVALSIIGFPIHELPTSAMREILRGGLDKMKEAGVPVIGGHSINDEEVKCGFAVVGTSPKDAYVRNAGARVGDVLVLTKPLGGGIVAFAHQIGRTTQSAMAELSRHMAHLNRRAGELMVKHGAHAATDITGFSLMGHLVEIVSNSGIEVQLDLDAIPVFPGVRELVDAEVIPGGVERNRESVDVRQYDLSALNAAEQAILFCPETSGGMLVFLSPAAADAFIAEMRAAGEMAESIGAVVSQCAGGKIVVHSGKQKTGPAATAAHLNRPGTQREADVACCQTAAQASNANRLANPSCCAAGPEQSRIQNPKSEIPLPPPAHVDAFKAYQAAVSGAGAIDLKHKKLIALALSVMGKCEPCVKINAKAAADAGATEQELSEAVAMGIAFGGSTVGMFYNMLKTG